MSRMGRAIFSRFSREKIAKPIIASAIDDGFRKSASRKNAFFLYPSYKVLVRSI